MPRALTLLLATFLVQQQCQYAAASVTTVNDLNDSSSGDCSDGSTTCNLRYGVGRCGTVWAMVIVDADQRTYGPSTNSPPRARPPRAANLICRSGRSAAILQSPTIPRPYSTCIIIRRPHLRPQRARHPRTLPVPPPPPPLSPPSHHHHYYYHYNYRPPRRRRRHHHHPSSLTSPRPSPLSPTYPSQRCGRSGRRHTNLPSGG